MKQFNLNEWHIVRPGLSKFDATKIINNLTYEMVCLRNKNKTCSKINLDKSYYDNKWNLEFEDGDANIFEYSYECLRMPQLHNYQMPENFNFFKSLDLFFRHLKEFGILVDKQDWIEHIAWYATKDTDQKIKKNFLENIRQYKERTKIMQEITELLDV